MIMVREIRPPFYFYWSAMRFMSSLFPHIFHTGHTRIFSTRLKKHQFKAHCLLAPHPVWEILFYGVGPKEILLQCESNDKINDTAHKNREENIHLWYKKWWLDFRVYWEEKIRFPNGFSCNNFKHENCLHFTLGGIGFHTIFQLAAPTNLRQESHQ